MMMAIEDDEGDQLVIHHHHPQVRMEESDQERAARRARNQARMAEVRMIYTKGDLHVIHLAGETGSV